MELEGMPKKYVVLERIQTVLFVPGDTQDWKKWRRKVEGQLHTDVYLESGH